MIFPLMTIPLISLAEGCGVAVHSYLVERIMPLLPAHIVQNAAFVRAGAFYPDAFYNCMGEYDAAEDAHWPPFLGSGIRLLNQRRAAGTPGTEQLEAFLVGVLTHQVSDISWHSLGIFQGLLRAMTEREFEGDYDDAHTTLDVGGDMIQLHRLTSDPAHSKWLNSEWDYNPVDIQEILRLNGYKDVTQSAIRYCMARGKAALGAEMNVANVGYKRFARRSPLLFDQLETYFAGGETDMQQQIEECMPRFLAWLNGTEFESPWDLCQVFEGKRPNHDHQELQRRRGSSILSVDGILEVLSDAKSSLKSSFKPNAVTTLDCDILTAPSLGPDEEVEFGTGNLRPSFGTAIVWWNKQWAISAPNEGKVYIYNQSFDLTGTISARQPSKIPGKFSSQFGSSMVVWDKYLVVASPGLSILDLFDEEGNWSGSITWNDVTTDYGARGVKFVGQALTVDADVGTLYVGAPYLDDLENEGDNQDHDQVGAVFVLPHSVLSKASSGIVLELKHDEHLMVKGKEPYERLGSQLAVTPRFVLVGSPGEARVFGFDFATHKRILTVDAPASPDSSISGFGGYLLTGDKDYVVIGAPASGESSGAASQGRVTIYKNTQMQTVEGAVEFEWLGSNGVEVSDTNRTLLLTSPHAADGRGALWTLDLRTQSLTNIGSPPASAGSGFGQSIASNGTTAVIGMPFYQANVPRLGAVAVVGL